MNGKERIYAVIDGAQPDRIPITPIFMEWAARYIGHCYRDFYLDDKVLVEAQLAVTSDFNTDQISVISDPWRESSAYGMEFDYPENGCGIPEGHLLNGPEDLARLKNIDVEHSPRTAQRIAGVAAMAGAVGETHSVLGWVEGPMAQYADLRDVQMAMMDLCSQPEMFEEAAEIITDNAIQFAVAQVRAGADMIGVGDAAASLIGPALYEQHVLKHEQRLFKAIHDEGAAVKLHICGNITAILPMAATSGADVIDVDSMVDLVSAREAVGDKIVLCGNLDPAGLILRGTPEAITAEVARIKACTAGTPFFLMPGCEVPPASPVENVKALCAHR